MKQLTLFWGLMILGFAMQAQNGITILPMAPVDSSNYQQYKRVSSFIGDDDNIYVGYNYVGLAVYDSTEWVWYNTANSDLPSNEVTQLAMYDNKLYVSTLNGLGVFDGSSWTIVNTSSGLPNDTILGYFKDGVKEYFAHPNSFTEFNGSTYTSYPVMDPEHSLPANFNSSSIAKDNAGNIWLGRRAGGGVYKFSNNTLSMFDSTDCTRFLADGSKLWIGTNYDGLKYIENGNVHSIYDICTDGFEGDFRRILSIFKGIDNSLFFTYNQQIHQLKGDQIFSDYIGGGGTSGNMAFIADDLLYWIPAQASYQQIKIVDLDEYNSFNQPADQEENEPDYQNAKELDVNMVRARVNSTGGLFWDMKGSSQYEVPKGSGHTATHAEALWIGGYDQQTNLRVAAKRHTLQDFWPGPILNSADTTTLETADQYDKIWKVNRKMIEEFKYMWDIGAVSLGTYSTPYDMVTWPGIHPITGEMMAPFFDNNNDGIYNYLDGDYPEIRGDEMLWWVMNDFIPVHEQSGGMPMKVEIYMSFYAYVYENAPNDHIDKINYQTFMHADIINRSGQQYDSCYLGYYSELSLGYVWDDFTGCNVDLNTMYVYNGLPYDGNGQSFAYGGPNPTPPVYGITVLNGPLADENDGVDNDRDFIVDEPGESCMMSSYMYFNCDGGLLGCPFTDADHYNYSTARWKDGSHMRYGGNGHYNGTASSVDCQYMFPGLSDPNGWGQNGQVLPEWSETAIGNPEGFRRGLAGIGAFTFEPDEKVCLDLAYCFSWLDDSVSTEDNLNASFALTQQIIDWYNGDSIPSNYEFVIDSTASVKEYKSIELKLYPNPTKDILNISCNEISEDGNIYKILDMHGRVLKTGELPIREASQVYVGNLARGIYFVKLSAGKRVVYGKFIKD